VDEIFQAQPALEAGEGLPFWLLWFLLFVIILLVAFIFLRDKDLRRRLSSFLSGARRHMLRLRLQVKLKKERQKKTALWRELGKMAWNEDFRAPCIEGECAKLTALEEEIGRHQKTWHDVYSRIEVLGKEHEAALQRFRALVAEQEESRRPHQEEMAALAGRKREILDALESALREAESAEAQIKAAKADVRAAEDGPRPAPAERASRADKARDKVAALAARARDLRGRVSRLQEERYRLERRLEEVEGRIRVFNSAIRRIDEEYRERLEARGKEIREWQKAKEHVQDKIVGVKRLMEPLFENVGRILDEARIDHEDMAVLYFQIDGVDRAISEIETRLEHLK